MFYLLITYFSSQLHGEDFVTIYQHVLEAHSADQLEKFKNLRNLSQEGFEHSQKVDKRVWERATSHGGGKNPDLSSSILQTFKYHYRVLFLLVIFNSQSAEPHFTDAEALRVAQKMFTSP